MRDVKYFCNQYASVDQFENFKCQITKQLELIQKPNIFESGGC